MRAVIQRAARAEVAVDGRVIGRIGPGLVILLGVGQHDTEADAEFLASKIVGLRIFSDDEGKMNRSLLETGGGALIISQFTLWGDCRKGRRPSFVQAAPPEMAERLYEYFIKLVSDQGVETATGKFGAMMAAELVNDGPVTLIVESKNERQ